MPKDRILIEYEKSFEPTGENRNHIILMDGTWNDETGKKGSGLVTNIVNMHRVFVNDEKQQIVRYHRGVGNDNDNGFFASLKDGITGKGVLKIVERAYVRFVQDWKPGDNIYIFGFSRGAAGARLLASKINALGVPKNLKIQLIPKENKELKSVEQILYKYSINEGLELNKKIEEKVRVKILGVWDTVSAFGLINNIARAFGRKYDLFSNNTIASNIDKAIHLVATDETRNSFTPSLINFEGKKTFEVWFPGVHSDIGGSYLENELAKCSLHYMLKLVDGYIKKEKLPAILKVQAMYKSLTLSSTKKAHFHFHGLGKLKFKSLRDVKVKKTHPSELIFKPNIHKLYYDLSSSNECFAVVKKGKKKRITKFQYMPYNIKQLKSEFNIVK